MLQYSAKAFYHIVVAPTLSSHNFLRAAVTLIIPLSLAFLCGKVQANLWVRELDSNQRLFGYEPKLLTSALSRDKCPAGLRIHAEAKLGVAGSVQIGELAQCLTVDTIFKTYSLRVAVGRTLITLST